MEAGCCETEGCVISCACPSQLSPPPGLDPRLPRTRCGVLFSQRPPHRVPDPRLGLLAILIAVNWCGDHQVQEPGTHGQGDGDPRSDDEKKSLHKFSRSCCTMVNHVLQ